MDPSPDLDLTFTALADRIRRSLIHALARGGALSARELGQQLGGDSRTIARHLQFLERVGLIERFGEGRSPRFRLCHGPLQAALGWIDRQGASYVQSLEELDRRLSLAAGSPRRGAGN